MVLQSLHELYGRLQDDPEYQIAPPGYSPQKISFKVIIKPDGELFAIEDARVQEGKYLRPQQRLVPGAAKPSGSGLNPCFLWDNSGYMLGFKPDDPKPERTLDTFEAFRVRHLELESEVNSAAFSAVCGFLTRWDPLQAESHEILRGISTGFGVFQLLGETAFVHDDRRVKSWWDAHGIPQGGAEKGRCLITGQPGEIASTHPKIKRVKDAQSSGAAIVSFNEDAYESYGKSQSLNAPVSKDAAFRYTTALNALLDGPRSPKHRLILGDTTVVFWTAKPTVVEDVFARFFSEGSGTESDESQDGALRQKLEMFFRAMRKGQEAYGDLDGDADRTGFFVLGLSPNAARISIRFFYQGSVKDVLDNLRRHYADIRIAPQPASGRRKADPEFPAIWLLLAQTARKTKKHPDGDPKEVPPLLAGPLLQATIAGAPYPAALFTAVLRRVRADREVTYARACVIKGYLTRNKKMEVSMSLDTDRNDPAYRLGRLFSALEKTQLDALGNVNASIRDRFYSSASATPRTVFPRILRTYQHHLGKLEGGRKVNREKLIQEILAPVEGFPAHLGLEGQGLFAIGYYHQTRDFYTKKEA